MMKRFFKIGLLLLTLTMGVQGIGFGQNQIPGEDECRLNIVAENMDGQPRDGELIIVTAPDVPEKFEGYTDKDGSVTFLVPQGHKYHISFRTLTEKRDYTDLEIPEVDGALVYDFKMSFEMTKKVFKLRNVFYDTGKATLRPESFKALNELVDILNHKTHMRIEVGGHTDDVGEHDDNMHLSKARSQSVVAYLVSKGIAADRLEAEGYGETMPVASNETPEGRQENRRTEIKILHE